MMCAIVGALFLMAQLFKTVSYPGLSYSGRVKFCRNCIHAITCSQKLVHRISTGVEDTYVRLNSSHRG